ncbi:hypothetical protein CG747_17750 [Streptomyces sp. CB02959]|uniref:hypothetical protein n=1 Tax=Streptomyces sp. CB02959 TaxID=2020330 RepID=UPI000C27BE62|nr:hypothetical protein [Streptomyces sp. CB02959]PJN39295.1 hypothetical protein CG747_17750 [Streptomyces sp. CB02959]
MSRFPETQKHTWFTRNTESSDTTGTLKPGEVGWADEVSVTRNAKGNWHLGESVVSRAGWLGHSDPGLTLRKYSHFLPRAGARGSTAIDAIFA